MADRAERTEAEPVVAVGLAPGAEGLPRQAIVGVTAYSPEESHLEDLAVRAEARASRARQHALIARSRAGRNAARGDRDGEILYRSEAEGHERAARANEQTAALYRRRAGRLHDGVVRLSDS